MEIKFDSRNYRKHNDRNKELIRKSLNECGAGRSIVIDNNNEIIAGNGIYEQAQELGIKTKIVETDGSCKEMVILKNCEFYSMCEHHMFPFFGHISIGYIPNGKVIGISKLARLVDCFAKRMQIQERITSQIADTIMEELGALGVIVVCEGVHFCMRSRGVKKQDASMVTSAVRGVFAEDSKARQEFLSLIKE